MGFFHSGKQPVLSGVRDMGISADDINDLPVIPAWADNDLVVGIDVDATSNGRPSQSTFATLATAVNVGAATATAASIAAHPSNVAAVVVPVVVAEEDDTATINAAAISVADITLVNDTDILVTGEVANVPTRLIVILRQDEVGEWTVTWPTGTLWDGGTIPTLSTAAESIDVFELVTVDAGTTWFGRTFGLAFDT